jgi:phage terminase large subunit-like protein
MFDEDGEARYRTVFIGIPRKQGKTELVAAILLFLMFGTGRRGQRIYSASGDRKQAALIYGAAASMVRQSEALSACSLVFDGYKEIRCEPLDSKYEALSSEAQNQYGLRPNVILLDEVFVFPNRDLYNALTSALGATKKPLIIMITTAGHDRHSLCYEQWDYARGVRDGLIDDPTFLPILFETDPEEDWTSEAVWRKAMPALGDFCELSFIREECKKAQRLPAYENTFRQLYLNQWTEQATRWIPVVAWMACKRWVGADEMDGKPCYVGYDHGVTGDMAALAIAFPDGDGGYDVLARCYVPKEGKWRDELRNRDRYEQWIRDGFLVLTYDNTSKNQVNNSHQIEADIVRLVGPEGRFYLRLMLADRAYATEMLLRLSNDHGMKVKGIPQGPVTLNEAMVRFEELVISKKIRCDNPIMDWNIQNAVVYRNKTGLMILDKEQANERIDCLQALINALAGAVSDPENNVPSVYETRGPLIF